MRKNPQFEQEIERFKHTKQVFQCCSRLLNLASFSGSESDNVSECKALMQFMVRETEANIANMKAEFRKAQESADQSPQPAPATISSEVEGVLGAHLPEEVASDEQN